MFKSKARIGTQAAMLVLMLIAVALISGSGADANSVSPNATASINPSSAGGCKNKPIHWNTSWGSVPPYRDVEFSTQGDNGGFSLHNVYYTSKAWTDTYSAIAVFHTSLNVEDSYGNGSATGTASIVACPQMSRSQTLGSK